MSDVSHELRTPLTTLRMASEVIAASRDSFDPTVARSTELLVAQLDRFERLLEDLLEVSRFDAEVAVLEAVDFDIVQLVNRCADDLALVAKERKTQIYVKSAEPTIIEELSAFCETSWLMQSITLKRCRLMCRSKRVSVMWQLVFGIMELALMKGL